MGLLLEAFSRGSPVWEGLTELSDAGRTLARRVQSAMSEVALGLDELARSPDRLSGVVRVTAPTEVGSAFLLPGLVSFTEAEPGVELQLHLGAIVLDLERREADIAVRTVRPTRGDIVTRRLGSARLAPFHAPTLPLEQARQRWLTWLEDDPWVRAALERDPTARVVLRSNDLAGLRSACCLGLGTALLPEPLADFHGLVQLEGTEAFEGPPLWIAAPRTSLEIPPVRAVWDHILQHFDAAA